MRKRILNLNVATILATFLLPVLLNAGVATTYELPGSGYISNVVIDIIEHNGGVWFATSDGVNFSFDNGDTWSFYDNSNGLVSSNITALFSIPASNGEQRIWVGTGHDEIFSGDNLLVSDGVSYSDNDGDPWMQIIFDSTGQDINYVWGAFQTVYDITGYYDAGDPGDDWLFFAAFAGGLLASRDGGINWRRIYPSASDSVQFNEPDVAPSLRNRYFSCDVDASHGDSLFLWAGTAEGFFQYIYSAPRDRAYTQYINSIVFCSECGDDDSNYVYLAGDPGVTRGAKTGTSFLTRFEDDGLPGDIVTALIDFGGRLFAGTASTIDSSSTGLAESTDFGESYLASATLPATGANNRILDFAVVDERLYVAAEEAGLFVSEDTGATWGHISVDPLDETAANRRNVVNAVYAWGDTLLVGTDSGLVSLFLDNAGAIDSSRFFVFNEDATSSTKVIRIKVQQFAGSDVIWTVNRPLSSGTSIVGRSADRGETFVSMQVGVDSHDLNFFGDTAFVATDDGLRFSIDDTNPSIIYEVKEFSGDDAIDSLSHKPVTRMEILGDTIFIGTDSGYAVSLDRGDNYDIVRIQTDTLSPNGVLQYTVSVDGLTGDFIPALAVQNLPDTTARVWISGRPVYSGSDAISVGRIDEAFREIFDTAGVVIDTEYVYIYNWDSVHNTFAWNFSFNGDTVFAATDEGLIWALGDDLVSGDLTWNTLDLVNEQGEALVLPGTPIYATEVIGNFLWIGTGDRTVRVNLNDFTQQRPFYVVDSVDEVYAFPVPFSHALDAATEFHFTLLDDADVTIEIYDFAMNLVRRVVDNQLFLAGTYPTAGSGRVVWDGLNGRGDPVAVGMYYFKVEYSTGEIQWGKLAVIP